MGTLSKAVGGYGGYLCASKPVIALMHNRARTLIYSISCRPPLSPPPSPRSSHRDRARLCGAAAAARLHPADQSAGCASLIVPVVIGEADTLAASRLLADNGFVAVIRLPTVPQHRAAALIPTAQHADADIERSLAWCARVSSRTRPLLMSAVFVTSTGTDRQDLHHRRADPPAARTGRRGRRAETRGQRL